MGILVLLIAVSVSIALLFLGIFYWNIKSGQFDDTYTPSVRMLFDSKPKNKEVKTSQSKSDNTHTHDSTLPTDDEAKNHS